MGLIYACAVGTYSLFTVFFVFFYLFLCTLYPLPLHLFSILYNPRPQENYKIKTKQQTNPPTNTQNSCPRYLFKAKIYLKIISLQQQKQILTLLCEVVNYVSLCFLIQTLPYVLPFTMKHICIFFQRKEALFYLRGFM